MEAAQSATSPPTAADLGRLLRSYDRNWPRPFTLRRGLVAVVVLSAWFAVLFEMGGPSNLIGSGVAVIVVLATVIYARQQLTGPSLELRERGFMVQISRHLVPIRYSDVTAIVVVDPPSARWTATLLDTRTAGEIRIDSNTRDYDTALADLLSHIPPGTPRRVETGFAQP